MDLQKILETALLVGADLPAYKALLDEIISIFSEEDQATLKANYAAAMAQSDAAHEKAQEQ